MQRPNQPRVCKTPDLCVVACPYNRILSELGGWVCAPSELLPDDQEAAIEIIFGDAPSEHEQDTVSPG